MYTDSGPVSGMPEKCRKVQRSPRFIIRYAATGESMPPDISATARPLIPTGSPPCPGCPPVKTNTSWVSTSTKISVSGCLSDTGSPCAALTSAPISAFSCSEVTGNRLSRRRDRTANAPLSAPVSATAAAIAASGVLSTRSARQTRTIPGTSAAREATRSTAAACCAGVRPSRATRSTSTPSRRTSSARTPVPRTAARRFAVQHPLELLPVASLEEDLALLEQHARLACDQSRRPGGGDRIGHGHLSSLPVPPPGQARLGPRGRKGGEIRRIQNGRG